jgi:vesicle-fusing ATPase
MNVLSALGVLLTKVPPIGRRRFILATTAKRTVLEQLELCTSQNFSNQIAVPNVASKKELGFLLAESGHFEQQDVLQILDTIEETTGSPDIAVGVKNVLQVITKSTFASDPVDKCAEILSELIVRNKV